MNALVVASHTLADSAFLKELIAAGVGPETCVA